MRKQTRPKQTSAIIGLLLFSIGGSAFAANADAADWQTYKGSSIAYVQVGLPTPVAIYTYDQTGSLVGVIETGGKYTPTEIEHVKTSITSKSFTVSSDRKLKETGRTLKHYLADQGYKISDILNSNASYTMIIVEWDASNLGCEWLTRGNTAYENALEEAITLREQKEASSVKILKLSSRRVKISCRKP